MILRFATRRNANGYRKILIINHDKKIYSRTAAHWYSREDFIETTNTDRNKLIDFIEAAGYIETDQPL